MSDEVNYRIRPATKADEPFLREMLFETLLAEDDADLMTQEMMEEPTLARYVIDWGSDENDMGFIAEDVTGKKIGAVWSRLLVEENKGYGFVDNKTPELAIALTGKCRGKGIGRALMKTLISAAGKKYPALCLSVAPKNPAKKLYESLGFKTVEIRDDHPVMVLDLRSLKYPER